MFNILNNREKSGKRPPMVCKFLGGLSGLSHGVRECCGRRRYLLEGKQLRNRVFEGVGLRIAFLVRQPVLIGVRRRKD
jgi:hypothetical protein